MATSTIAERLKKVLMIQFGLEESDVTPTASFVEDFNADSLDLVELMMEIEREFDIDIKPEEMEKITTAGEATDFLKSRLRSMG
jgi:acyl carrier protein